MNLSKILEDYRKKLDKDHEKEENLKLDSLVTTADKLDYLKTRSERGILGVFCDYNPPPGFSGLDWRTKRVFEEVLIELFERLKN